MDKLIDNYKKNLISTIDNFFEQPLGEAIELINKTLNSGNTIFLAGNGGSAAMSDHFATDWSKGIYESTKKVCKVRSLSSNNALNTAIANDLGYDNVISEQLKLFAEPQDLLVLISSSGNSKNIVSAMHFAKQLKIKTIILTSTLSVNLNNFEGVKLVVSSSDIQIIEDIHNLFGHLVLKSYMI